MGSKAEQVKDGVIKLVGDSVSLDNALTYRGGESLVDGSKVENSEYALFAKGKQIVSGLEFGGEMYGRATPGELTGDSIEKIENRFMDLAEGTKIPEEIAKYRGAEQVRAGGEFEIDTDIDDFNDALASFGITQVTLKPVEKAKKAVSSENNAMKNSSKMGIGLIAVPAALYALYKVFA